MVRVLHLTAMHPMTSKISEDNLLPERKQEVSYDICRIQLLNLYFHKSYKPNEVSMIDITNGLMNESM